MTTSTHSQVILGVSGAEQLGHTPGRMLARLGDGRLRELQGYWVGEEVLAGLGDNIDPLALLDNKTRAMVHFAYTHLGGRFPQAEIMAGGWTRPAYRQAVDKLRRAGVLERREHGALYLVEGTIF